MKAIKYISYDEAILLYKRVVQRYGGKEGLINPGGLHSSLNVIKATFRGEELYPTIWQKAGMMLYSLNKNHPFLEGNKRMSALITELFLAINGYILDISSEQFKGLIKKAAKSEADKEGIIDWLKLHIRQKTSKQRIT